MSKPKPPATTDNSTVTRVYSVGSTRNEDRPFAVLAQLLNAPLPLGETHEVDTAKTTAPAPHYDATLPPLKGLRVKVERSRSGHGGKTVTRLFDITLDENEAQALLIHLKRKLGVGGTLEVVEDEPQLHLHGDLRDRLSNLLSSYGMLVKKSGG